MSEPSATHGIAPALAAFAKRVPGNATTLVADPLRFSTAEAVTYRLADHALRVWGARALELDGAAPSAEVLRALPAITDRASAAGALAAVRKLAENGTIRGAENAVYYLTTDPTDAELVGQSAAYALVTLSERYPEAERAGVCGEAEAFIQDLLNGDVPAAPLGHA